MSNKEKILIRVLSGKKAERVPFWFMRQAGRFLPEYRELRSKYKNFLEFCYTPEAASEATLQPVKRFGMDGAIIFSDILVIPDAMGVNVHFEEGKGPILSPVRSKADIANLTLLNEKHLKPVYEALKHTKQQMPEETTLIGFAGLPWTLACYMVEGGSSRDFEYIKVIVHEQVESFNALIEKLTAAVTIHCINQVKAGAEVIQLFDSWAGILNEEQYEVWCIKPTRQIVAAIKKEYPHVPVIGFPRQSGIKFSNFAEKTGVNAVSVDNSVPLEWIANTLQAKTVVQGCLSNEILAGDRELMLKETRQIIEMLKEKPFVFNLGHGILPHTPVENMQALCEYLKRTRLNA